MTHRFNCIATGIGSLPITDPDKAAALSLQYLPEAPIWPQLPQRDFREHMDGQYSESLPGPQARREEETVFFRYLEGPYAGTRKVLRAVHRKGLRVLQDLRRIRGGVPCLYPRPEERPSGRMRGSSKATSPAPSPPAYPSKMKPARTSSTMTCSSMPWSRGSP